MGSADEGAWEDGIPLLSPREAAIVERLQVREAEGRRNEGEGEMERHALRGGRVEWLAGARYYGEGGSKVLRGGGAE
jgi:hypothetical protein